jgi:hypothetical protein
MHAPSGAANAITNANARIFFMSVLQAPPFKGAGRPEGDKADPLTEAVRLVTSLQTTVLTV